MHIHHKHTHTQTNTYTHIPSSLSIKHTNKQTHTYTYPLLFPLKCTNTHPTYNKTIIYCFLLVLSNEHFQPLSPYASSSTATTVYFNNKKTKQKNCCLFLNLLWIWPFLCLLDSSIAPAHTTTQACPFTSLSILTAKLISFITRPVSRTLHFPLT